MKSRLLLIAIVCLLYFIPVYPQPVQYPFSHLDISNGLSHNQVSSILKDAKGFMWFGTGSGLDRYDGYTFKVFHHNENDSASLNDDMVVKMQEGPDNKFWIDTRYGQSIFDPVSEKANSNVLAYCKQLSLPAAPVTGIVKDKQGCFWFAQTGYGLSVYNPVTHAARRFARQPVQNNTPEITGLCADSKGNIWVMYTDGLLQGINTAAGKIIFSKDDLFKKTDDGLRYKLFADADGDLWIFTENYPQGVFNYRIATNTLNHFHRDAAKNPLNNNLVTGIQQDNNGLLWICTDHGGVNLLNKNTGAVLYLESKPEDTKSLSQNSINAIYRDNTGIIWLGTYKKGINYYHESIIKFPVYRHLLSDPGSIPYDDINRFVEDDKGNLWIGTNGGGLIYYDRTAGTFRTYKHNAANTNSISNDVIVSLCIDHEKKLWIGSYYGGLDCFDGKNFIHYKNNPADANSISDNNIWEIYEDTHQQLWVGTLSGGLNRFDREKKIFYHYRKAPNGLISNYVAAFAEDTDGNLWIGTEQGISIMDYKTGSFRNYVHNSKDAQSLSNNGVTALLKDDQGRMWVTTHDGLNLFDKTTGSFRHFNEANGLSNNNVLTLLQDDTHTLWLGTANGVSRAFISGLNYNVQLQFRNYDERDGLQGREFNENAAWKTRRGELIFGGANGFNIINPLAVSHNTIVPEVVLTDLHVFDKSPQPGEVINNRVLLNTTISDVKEITLKYKENIFSLEFAALNYANSEKNQYAYKLEGFNNDWLTTDGTQRKVTYTNLDPGKYIFRVRASNGDGIWNEKGAALQITILPPFWRTIPAFIIYALLIIAILFIARRLTIQRAHMRFQLAQQKKEAERVHELDLLKLKFFTNVSHEFRTPLSLIMGPVEKMLKQSREPEQKKQYQLIYRNARRLLALVNQLLDFRKLEMQELRLYPSVGDIVSFVKEISYSFTDMAGTKNIHFNFTTTIESLHISFDPDKLERILFNLLSNAFKFTPEHGTIQVMLDQEAVTANGEQTNYVSIKVKDSGIGIPAEEHEKIFERFFQHNVPGSILNQGSGIGLAISKEFVRLHQGTISVESAPGKGTCFTVLLPVNTAAAEANVPANDEAATAAQEMQEGSAKNDKAARKKPVILIVDDNEDIRFYLKDNLRRTYTVLEAVNGAEGWEKTRQHHPDLVVSDVMMPVMDGLELCRKIKHDADTSHIPVILLTARSAAEPKLEGFQVGANDYVTKPFSFEMLQSRIKNLLAQADAMRKLFQKQVEVNPTEISITSVDEQFLRQALEAIEKNIADPDFSVEDLSRALHMSRVALYKKLLALTGKSPLDFIKSIRLKRAARLLEKSQLTVSEIAYEVGFNNPKYFARTFRKEFGVLPSEYLVRKDTKAQGNTEQLS